MNDCGGSHSASTKASSNAPRSRIRFASRSKPSAARSKRGDSGPLAAGGTGSPPIAATQTSSVYTSRSAISRRARLLALEPDERRSPGRSGRASASGGERRRRGQQLAHAVEVVRDHPVRQVAPRDRLARAGDQQARGRVEVDAVGRRELRPRRRTRSAAHRRRARTRARTPPASRSRRPSAASEGDSAPVRSCQAARSSSSRRRSATGDSPVAAASSRSRWSREKCARRASVAPSAGSSSEARTTSISSRRRSSMPSILIVFDVSLDATRAERAAWRAWLPGPNSPPRRPSSPSACRSASTPTSTRRWPRSGATASPRISGTETPVRATASCGSARCGRRSRRSTCSATRATRSTARRSTPTRTGRARPRSPASRRRSSTPRWSSERNGEAAAGGPSHLFRLDVTRGLDGRPQRGARPSCVIEVWTPERGVRVIER